MAILDIFFRSSDFPYVVPECGYKGGKEAVLSIANQVPLSSSELEWIMGKTVMQLFQGQWVPWACTKEITPAMQITTEDG